MNGSAARVHTEDDSEIASYCLPIYLKSAANLREHWAEKHRRVKAHRKAAYLCVKQHALPCVVTLTRVSPRSLDDDNLRTAFKGIRDGVADRLGIADNDPRVAWRYEQTKGRTKQKAIRIEIEAIHD